MKAFLSYSRQDADFAGFFKHVLALGAPDVDLWFDERIGAGERYPQVIDTQIAACDYFFFAASPAWLDSSWCQREAKAAKARGTSITVVPLRIEDAELAKSGLASHQEIDLRRWRIDGDQVLRERLFHLFAAPVAMPRPGTEVLDGMREVVLWSARSQTPEPVAARIAALATWHATFGLGPPLTRARLLDAQAGLHLTRRRWRDMIGATRAALELLKDDGWSLPEEAGFDGLERTDDELAFVGELYNRLGLGARQLGDARGREQLEHALTAFSAIRQPLLRHERTAQMHRELGTWSQEDGDLDVAREHFRNSGILLDGLPSQRFHVLQAQIKEAQVDLAQGQVSDARCRLDAVAPKFAEGVSMDGRLAHQVLPHFLLTDAACSALEGDDARAIAALRRHEHATTSGSGGSNRRLRRRIRTLLALPVTARPIAVSARAIGQSVAAKLWSR